MWLIGGGIGVSSVYGAVSPDYRVYRFDKTVHPHYAHHLLRSLPYRDQYRLLVRAETTFDRRITADDFEAMPICVPPIAVQRCIADYLDRETARIVSLLERKKALLALLAARRASVRDREFRTRPGWPLKRLLAARMAYGVLVPEFVDDGIPMVRTYNLTDRGGISHADIAEISPAMARQYTRTSLRPGDLILSVVGSMGRAAVVSSAENGYNLNRPLARLRFNESVPSRLIWHWTQTTTFLDLARLATGSGTAQPTLNLGDLARFRIGLPSDPTTWAPILGRLDEATRRIDAAGDVIDRQISLLQERRQALITAAVTGELDVAGVAA
jgi:type I restriction enzyme S subunit